MFMAIFNSKSNLFDKAKQAGNAIKDMSLDLVNDEKLADLIIKAVQRQEGVNNVLKMRGCNYRVSNIDLEMGLPPKIIFGVSRVYGPDE
jgi:hypothetical protein